MIAYVYELKDCITGKWYIGSRTAKGCDPSDLGMSYFTSSKVVEPLFRENPTRFEKRILVKSEDADYVIRVESDILRFRNARKDPSSYNVSNGDGEFGGHKAGKIGGAARAKSGELQKLCSKAGKVGGVVTGNIFKQKKMGVCGRTQEEMSEHGKMGGPLAGKITGKQIWQCNVCNMKSKPGALGKHQKASGHVGKTRLI